MDSLRGAGALAVVVAHAYNALHTRTFPAHGYLDDLHNTVVAVVPIFFALSGFLLFRPYLAAVRAGRPLPSARKFFRRRVLRVIPGYWVALTLAAIIIPAAAIGTFGSRWWVLYGLGQSYSIKDNFHGLAVAWTLSVDASFYILMPGFAWLVARAARRVGWERAAWGLVAAMSVLGLTVRVLNTIFFSSHGLVVAIEKIVYALPGEVNYFAVGIGLAILSVRGRPPRLASRPTLCWALAAATYMVIAAFFSYAFPYGGFDFRTRFVANDVLTMVFVSLLMLPTAFDVRPGVPRSVLSWRPLAFVGVVSYGLYLWHTPVELWLFRHGLGGALDWDYVPRVLVTTIVIGAVSMVFATASYYLIELPFLRRK